MTFTTKAFDVNAENIAYYLDLPIDIEVDYWTTKHDGNLITWQNEAPRICESILVRFHWSISQDDITWTQQAMLKHRYDAFETNGNVEGEFMIYTITTRDKDWEIDFDIECGPLEVNFNFLDRKIQVI